MRIKNMKIKSRRIAAFALAATMVAGNLSGLGSATVLADGVDNTVAVSKQTLEDLSCSEWRNEHTRSIEVTEEGFTIKFKNYTDEATESWCGVKAVLYSTNEPFIGGVLEEAEGYCEYYLLEPSGYGWTPDGDTGETKEAFEAAGHKFIPIAAPDSVWESFLDNMKAGAEGIVTAKLVDDVVELTMSVAGAASVSYIKCDTTKPVYLSLTGECVELKNIEVSEYEQIELDIPDYETKIYSPGWMNQITRGIEVTEEGFTINFKNETYDFATESCHGVMPILYSVDKPFKGGNHDNMSNYSEYYVLRCDGFAWTPEANTGDMVEAFEEAGNKFIAYGASDSVWESFLDNMKAGAEGILTAKLVDDVVELTLSIAGLTTVSYIKCDTTKPVYLSLTAELAKITDIKVSEYKELELDIPDYETKIFCKGWRTQHTRGIEVTEEGFSINFKSKTYEWADDDWYGPIAVLYSTDKPFKGGDLMSRPDYKEYYWLESHSFGWAPNGDTGDMIEEFEAAGNKFISSNADESVWKNFAENKKAGTEGVVTAKLVGDVVELTMSIAGVTSKSYIKCDMSKPVYLSLSAQGAEVTDISVSEYKNIEVEKSDCVTTINCSGWRNESTKGFEVTKEGFKLTFDNKTYEWAEELWHGAMAVLYSVDEPFMGGNYKEAKGYEEYYLLEPNSFGWTADADTDQMLKEFEAAGNKFIKSDADETVWKNFLKNMQAGTEGVVTAKLVDDAVELTMSIAGVTSTSYIKCDTSKPVYLSLTGELTKLTNITVSEYEKIGGEAEEPVPDKQDKPTDYTTEKDKLSLPETVKKEDVVEAKNDKEVVDKTVEKMNTSKLNIIAIIVEAVKTVTNEVFETMKEQEKTLTMGVKDESDKLQYSWTFSSDTLKDDKLDMDIDLTITLDEEKIDTKKKENIEKELKKHKKDDSDKDIKPKYIEFGHHGELPGPATIKPYVGDTYKNGEVVYIYYFDEEKNEILKVGNKPIEVKGGYVEYTITHCSTYFLSTENLVVDNDKASLSDASVTVTDEKINTLIEEIESKSDTTITSPSQTGDSNSAMVFYAFIVAMASAGVFVLGRKKFPLDKLSQ